MFCSSLKLLIVKNQVACNQAPLLGQRQAQCSCSRYSTRSSMQQSLHPCLSEHQLLPGLVQEPQSPCFHACPVSNLLSIEQREL